MYKLHFSTASFYVLKEYVASDIDTGVAGRGRRTELITVDHFHMSGASDSGLCHRICCGGRAGCKNSLQTSIPRWRELTGLIDYSADRSRIAGTFDTVHHYGRNGKHGIVSASFTLKQCGKQYNVVDVSLRWRSNCAGVILSVVIIARLLAA